MVALDLLIGLAPVALFLVVLLFVDSYKLVTRRSVFVSVAAGVVAAVLAWPPNALALGPLHLDPLLVRRYIAPIIEEILKAILIVHLIRAHRIGFMVDAAIHGFAVGTGFALIENLYYALTLGTTSIPLWIVRGFGTALLHGSTTALVAILSKDLTDRHGSQSLVWFLPGLGVAIVVHSLFNHVLVNPLVTAALMLVLLPLLVFTVFELSERATRDWLGVGLDGDMDRYQQIEQGGVPGTPIGDYLESLRSRFSPEILADMLRLLSVHVALSIRAKGLLIARGAGLDLPLDDEVRSQLDELRRLEHAIGPVGRLALQPLLRVSSRDLWQRVLLEG
jgi:RsiW-degrading membrane proteinase PrsW (M82 family)